MQCVSNIIIQLSFAGSIAICLPKHADHVKHMKCGLVFSFCPRQDPMCLLHTRVYIVECAASMTGSSSRDISSMLQFVCVCVCVRVCVCVCVCGVCVCVCANSCVSLNVFMLLLTLLGVYLDQIEDSMFRM